MKSEVCDAVTNLSSLIKNLRAEGNSKILMCVLDGLGGLPREGKTELEAARTPNLNRLAKEASCGLYIPVAPGITPGSGVAHLGLFGYDPLSVNPGRGILEAAGLGIKTGKKNLVARGNFATVEKRGKKLTVTDRRAGRISTRESARLVAQLSKSIGSIDGVKIKIHPGSEHRFVVVFSLPAVIKSTEPISDTDPQKEGATPLAPVAQTNEASAKKAAGTIGKFIEKTAEILKKRKSANYVLLRGFSTAPDVESFTGRYGMSAACVAAYPMYRGLARLLGMDVNTPAGGSPAEAMDCAEKIFANFDFMYVHIKSPDRYGENGDFAAKARAISDFDKIVPRIAEMRPDVLIVTGDHSTPSVMSSHSWHPVPLLLKSKYSLGGTSVRFGERDCLKGELGIIRSVEIMPLALAHAGRLAKFGA